MKLNINDKTVKVREYMNVRQSLQVKGNIFMTHKRILLSLEVVILVVCILLSGCNSTSNIATVSNEDLDVEYNGFIFNAHTSLTELSTQLSIPIGEENENSSIILSTSNGEIDYAWVQVSYPNKDKADFILDYLYNKTLKSGRIVSMQLKNVTTKRGVIVGDALEKLKRVYGNDLEEEYSSDTENKYSFKLANYEIYFIVEKSSSKILKIYLDFDRNQAMKEIDVTSLVD